MELLPVSVTPVLCPPHHWLIEGSTTLSGHQSWTCYRCGLVRPHEELDRPSYHRFAGRPARPVVPTPPVVVPDPVMPL
jgi:hypothetical protein